MGNNKSLNVDIYNNKYKAVKDNNGQDIILGSGSFGQVFKMQRIDHPYKKFAVKKLHRPLALSSIDEEEVKHEIAILMNLKCEFIVKFEEYFLQRCHLYLVLEFCDSGSLADQIENKLKTKTQFSKDQLIKWSNEIIHGIEYLHRQNIVHRDIKPANILIHRDTIKLADLGLAKSFSNNDSLVNTNAKGTLLYMSPEMIQKYKLDSSYPFSVKTDVWSVGIVIYELLTLQRPFKNEIEISASNIPDFRSESLYIKNLIKKMLEKDQNKRLDSSYFKRGIQKYQVQFNRNDVNDGQGLYFFRNGGIYFGEFKDSYFDGFGYLYNSLKLKYNGQWKEGRKEGAGKYYHENGDTYDGQFKNDMKHGHGVRIRPNGQRLKEFWSKNKLIFSLNSRNVKRLQKAQLKSR